MDNFKRYRANRTPFPIYQHVYWFNGGNYVLDGFIMFLDYLATQDHVYLVTVSKVNHDFFILHSFKKWKSKKLIELFLLKGYWMDQEPIDTRTVEDEWHFRMFGYTWTDGLS